MNQLHRSRPLFRGTCPLWRSGEVLSRDLVCSSGDQEPGCWARFPAGSQQAGCPTQSSQSRHQKAASLSSRPQPEFITRCVGDKRVRTLLCWAVREHQRPQVSCAPAAVPWALLSFAAAWQQVPAKTLVFPSCEMGAFVPPSWPQTRCSESCIKMTFLNFIFLR